MKASEATPPEPLAEPVSSAPIVPLASWPVVGPSPFEGLSPGTAPLASPPPEDEFPTFDFAGTPPPALTPVTTARKTPSTRGSVGWVIPVLLVAVLAGGFVYQKIRNQPVYQGQLVGERVSPGQEVAVIVRWDTIGTDPQTQQAVIEYFGRRPAVMINSLMEMRFGALPGGLEIRFSPGQSADLVRVNPHQILDIKKLNLQEAAGWDQLRKTELNAFAAELCRSAAQAQLSDVAVEGLPRYGRPLGINAMVRGLGYHVEAVHDRIRYPCVMEDKEGWLFFLVPDGARQFEVRERGDDAHRPVLPQDFSIQITVPPTIEETPRIESTMDEESPTAAPSSETSPAPPEESASSATPESETMKPE